MLGLKHILYMITVIIIIVIFHITIKKGKINFDKFLKFSAIISLMLDPIYWIWEYITFGHLRLDTTLPLYICSMFWMLFLIVAFSRKKGKMYRTALSSLLTVVAFGAILGFVLNTHISRLPFWHFRVQFSLFYHAFMLCIIALLWSTGYYKVQKNDIKYFFIPMLILMIPAFIVDKIYGYNYCYFNGGDGIVLEYFCQLLGLPIFVLAFYTLLYICSYSVLIIAKKIQVKNNSYCE